jgi:hypothetical protein
VRRLAVLAERLAVVGGDDDDRARRVDEREQLPSAASARRTSPR